MSAGKFTTGARSDLGSEVQACAAKAPPRPPLEQPRMALTLRNTHMWARRRDLSAMGAGAVRVVRRRRAARC